MQFLREHWFDVGMVLAALVGVYLIAEWSSLSAISIVLWWSLITLFLHQFEEYRYPGWFPGMLNSVLFGSLQPDRYPLNPQGALYVNLLTGWLSYFLAAVFAEKAIWLGIGSMTISLFNVVGHLGLFNIKGRTLYNPGMATALFLFLPTAAVFFYLVVSSGTASTGDWIAGLLFGGLLNYIGIYKLVVWMGGAKGGGAFPIRSLRPRDR